MLDVVPEKRPKHEEENGHNVEGKTVVCSYLPLNHESAARTATITDLEKHDEQLFQGETRDKRTHMNSTLNACADAGREQKRSGGEGERVG